jgi:hypothetical protein
MGTVTLLNKAYVALLLECNPTNESVNTPARRVIIVAGLHLSGEVNRCIGTVDTLLKAMEESNGITNQSPHT